MPTTFCVPGCQQKGRNSSAGENVWFFRFLGSPWGSNSGSIQFVDMKKMSLRSIVGGEISLFAAFKASRYQKIFKQTSLCCCRWCSNKIFLVSTFPMEKKNSSCKTTSKLASFIVAILLLRILARPALQCNAKAYFARSYDRIWLNVVVVE